MNQPKNNIEAEQSLLGSLLVDPDIIPYVMGTIIDSDFYDEKNIEIYKAIKELARDNKKIDIISVKDRLESLEVMIKLGGKEVVDKYKKSNQLEFIGGMTYITELVEIVPLIGNYKQYCDIIKEKSILRKYNTMSYNIERLLEQNIDSENLGKIIEKELRKINSLGISDDTEKLDDVLFRHLENLYDIMEGEESDIKSTKTGYVDIDAILGAMYGGDLIVIGGSSGIGKTMLGLNIINNVLQNKKKALLFSMEMNKSTLMNRFISMNTKYKLFSLVKWDSKIEELRHKLMIAKTRFEDGVDKDDLYIKAIETTISKEKIVKSDIIQDIMQEIEHITDGEFYINDKSGVTTGLIRKKIMELSITQEVDLVVIDQLSLMQGEGKGIRERYDIITGELKNIARDYNCTVLLMVQLSSKVIGAKPGHIPDLEDIKESSKIYEDSDKVILIDRPLFWEQQKGTVSEFTDTTLHCYIRKNRGGSMGKINLTCDIAHQKLINITKGDKTNLEINGE